MRTDGKDDAPTIEEILVFIRHLVADAPGDPSNAPPPDLPNFAALTEALDPGGSFELPALYRGTLAGSGNNQWPALSDERRDEDAPDDAQEAAVDLNAFGNRETGQIEAPALEAWFDTLSAAARTLEAIQASSIEQEGLPSPASLDGTAQVPAYTSALPGEQIAEINVPRMMSPCKDTVIGRMGQARREPELTESPVAREGPNFADKTPPVMQEPASQERDAPSRVEPVDGLQSGRVEDAAAATIRALVREWLDSSMRDMLEKALRDELKSRKGESGQD
jgi:hypothetical protein